MFVDIAAYNSKVYYVQGAVSSPGRFPMTGNETVLDGITHAGGVPLSALGSKTRLIRPASEEGGKEQMLSVDLQAIVEKGDTSTNYQLMPGDRVIVYPNDERANLAPSEPAKRQQAEARIDALIKELADLKQELGK